MDRCEDRGRCNSIVGAPDQYRHSGWTVTAGYEVPDCQPSTHPLARDLCQSISNRCTGIGDYCTGGISDWGCSELPLLQAVTDVRCGYLHH